MNWLIRRKHAQEQTYSLFHAINTDLQNYIYGMESVRGDNLILPIRFSTNKLSQDGTMAHVGGYADRIKGALSTFMLAILCGRPYEIEWSRPLPIKNIYKHSKVNWEHKALKAADEEDNIYTYDAIDYEAHARFNKDFLRSLPDAAIAKKGKAIKIHSNMNYISDMLEIEDLLKKSAFGCRLISLKKKLPLDDLIKLLMRLLFDQLFTYTPQGKYREGWAKFCTFSDGAKVLGVHVRTGSGNGWSDPCIDNLNNIDELFSAIKSVSTSQKIDRILLTSDSKTLKEQMISNLQDKFSCFSFEFDISHFERSIGVSADSQTNVAILEHQCLMRCSALVIGGGGFGRLAADLSGVPVIRYNET